MTVVIILFWVCLFIVFYTYFGYGILLFLLVKLKRLLKGKEKKATLPPDELLPDITLMICAYNEELVVAEKMENCRALNYPKDKLKIMWVTNGSTDSTNERLAKYDDVQVVFKPEREGKTAALNYGIHYVKTPLVAFTDANTMLNSESIREIVRAFIDPKVGCVSGEKRVCARTDGETAAKGEGLYWKYESTLKRWDSELCSAMGAAGELFAIRTHLYKEMPQDTLLDDFIMSMQLVDEGYKIAYTPEAYAMEYGSANMEEEAKRKRRICAGGLQSIARLTPLLNPFRHGVVTFQYISHRVLRWSVTPFALLALIPLNVILVLAKQGWIYNLIWILQVIFYLAAFLGWWLNKQGKKNKLLYVAYYFLFMNLNVFRGIKYLKTHKNNGAWEKAKRG